jgi:hypothetical protein
MGATKDEAREKAAALTEDPVVRQALQPRER